MLRSVFTQTGKARLAVIKDESGKTITETDEVLDRWKRYCEGMYRNDSDDDTSQVTVEEFVESLAPLNSEVEICVKIWNSGIWPVDWKRSIFIPLPKKSDLQLCSN